MKARPIHCLLFAVGLFAVASMASAGGVAGCQQNPDIEMPPLVSNGFFEVINSASVQFEEGVYWEVVKTKDGKEQVRYGVDASSLVAAGLDCSCHEPTICSESNCEVKGAGTGNATCRGGCYREDGTACVSCVFLEAQVQPR